MDTKQNNMFADLNASVKGPIKAWFLVLSIGCLITGCVFFAEDMASSRWGMEMLEQEFNIEASTYSATFWFGSAILQIFSLLFFAIYFANKQKHWTWFWLGLLTQLADISLDFIYRSRGIFDFSNPQRLLMAFVYTFLVTFVFSEGAITFGLGATLALFKDGFKELIGIGVTIASGLSEGAKLISAGKPNKPPQGQPQNHSPQGQPKGAPPQKQGFGKPSRIPPQQINRR